MKKRSIIILAISSIFALTSCDLLNNLMPNSPMRRSSKEEESQQVDRTSNNTPSSSRHKHSYGSWITIVTPTCTETGIEERYCECGERETRSIQALGHSFIDLDERNDPNYIPPTETTTGRRTRMCERCGITEIVDIPRITVTHNYVEMLNRTDGDTPKTLYMQCTDCGQCALRWDANEFNANLTRGGVTVRTMNDGNQGIRFGTVQYSNGNTADEGTHIFYQIYSPIALSNAGLSFYIQTHSSAPGYAIFDNYEGDTNFGYDYNENGELVQSTKRYGLRVNGTQIFLGEDNTEGVSSANEIRWFDWPVSFSVEKGINTFEFYGLGGYRPTISLFQINGYGPELLDAGQNPPDGHIHSYGEWITYSVAMCDISGEERRFCSCGEYQSRVVPALGHDMVQNSVVLAATCERNGIIRNVCTRCGATEDVEIPKIDHNLVGTVVESNEHAPAQYSKCSYCNKEFIEWSALDYDKEASINVENIGIDYIRFGSIQYSNQNSNDLGAHIIYKIYSPQSCSASLSFLITTSTGGAVPVFDSVDSDQMKGYEMDANGNFVTPAKRYGLLVNGERIYLADDDYGIIEPGTNSWFNWPVSFSLEKGINTLEIFALGGYRARMFRYRMNLGESEDPVGLSKCTLRYTGADNKTFADFEGLELLNALNLDNNIFTVTYDKQSALSDGALRTDSIRLYSRLGLAEGNKLSISTNGNYVIDSIKIHFLSSYSETAVVSNSSMICNGVLGNYEIDDTSFSIVNNCSNSDSNKQIRFTSIEIFYKANNANQQNNLPTGVFFTDVVLTENGKQALNVTRSAIPFLLVLGEANTVTVYADGRDAGAYLKSFNKSSGSLLIGTTLFGDLSMVYDSQLSMMMSFTMVEDLDYFAYNGIVSIKGNNKVKYWNCDGTNEQLQEQFVRRYNNPWVLDNNNADRLTSNSEYYITGSAMRLRPWADGRIALAAKDFDTAFTTNHLSFWVYNPGETNIQLSAFAYKGTSFTDYFQIFSGVTAKAGEWTYFSAGFTEASLYSFQVAITSGTSTALIFDDIALW